jgi:hypothetical protein
MTENLGFDGPLERYSRGLDSWVPLDSDASFAAMKRSIYVQRGAGDGHTRARVLLRIKPAKPDTPPVTQSPTVPPRSSIPINMNLIPVDKSVSSGDSAAPQINTDGGRMSFRPFARESAPAPVAEQQQAPPPPPPPPFGHPMPPAPNVQPPPMFFQPPVGPPTNVHMPPPPPPPPFPFDPRPRFFPPAPGRMPPAHTVNYGPHAVPLPPLVPERPAVPMREETGGPTETTGAEKTDAEMVLSLLHELKSQVGAMSEGLKKMGEKEKKHYESVRRGLKRIKDEESTKPIAAPEPVRTIEPVCPHTPGTSPCCICNYCLKGLVLFDCADNSRCGYLCHV